MNKIIIIAIIFLVLPPVAGACEPTLGVGKVVRGKDGEVGGFVTAGCVFRRKWDLRAMYYGEQRIYDETVRIRPFFAVAASRVWTFREGKRFQPVLGFGVILKQEQRCHFNGDLDCNRLLPLSYAFFPTVGLRAWDVMITVGHASNNGMDWGPEKKNLGLDSIRAEVVF